MVAPDAIGTRGIKVAMVTAVVAIFALAYLDLRREQSRALADFTAEQAALSRSLAATVGARMDAVFADLDTLITLDDAGRERLARQLIAARSIYREIDLCDGSAAKCSALSTPGGALIAGSDTLATARTELLAQSPPDGQGRVSAPLRRSENARERLRLFAARRADRAIVLLVDSDGFFAGAQAYVSAPMRWLVVDDARRWIELSPQATEATTWSSAAPAVSTSVASLLARMADGGEGTELLDRSAAAALGLDRRTAVASWARVPLDERLHRGKPWSVGAVVSAKRVRDRARLAAWRLAAATGLTALLVALFGVFIARQQRRSQQLAEALRLAGATLALRERSEKLVEAIPLGVLALDGDGRVTAVNPYLAERGVAPNATLAQALPKASPDDVAALQALVDDARARRQPTTRHGLRIHVASNEARDVDAYAVPLGRPLRDVDCFLVLHDRTEIRNLERNLQRAEKLATIGTLAAGVAHEVGTPLGIISGRAEQLLPKLPGGDSGEPLRKGVTSILAQVDKVSTTIRQLLDFARVRPVDAAVVPPAQALGHAAALLEHRFRHAKVALVVDAPPSVAPVAADPGQLEQVFVNLLMNACDACASGGQVTVRARQQGEQVAFDVIDDGVGISPEHLSSVLDPFFTTKKRGQGTGLGLTIAADIVKNHGGDAGDRQHASAAAPRSGCSCRSRHKGSEPAHERAHPHRGRRRRDGRHRRRVLEGSAAIAPTPRSAARPRSARSSARPSTRSSPTCAWTPSTGSTCSPPPTSRTRRCR